MLKQPKTDGSIREIDVPASTIQALAGLKELQENLKKELGPEGYADYGLVICQANGRPVMTEHLNKKFKDILDDLNDPDIDPKDFVFIVSDIRARRQSWPCHTAITTLFVTLVGGQILRC